MRKLILHIPHSSTEIPFLDGYVSDKKLIEQELLKITDWHTEDLFESKQDAIVIAEFSRLFCDVERFTDDSIEVMSKFGMGVLYETFDNGKIMRKVTPELREKILNEYYWKHHEKLNEAVADSLKRDGNCLIIDCHSFPKKPLKRALDKRINRPDFNIGTDNYHTPPELLEKAKQYFEKLKYSVGIDWPYNGSIVPMQYYQKDKRVSSIMLEVNRALYLEEGTNKKSSGYPKTKDLIQGFINCLRNW